MSTCTRITVILAASLCALAPPASCDTISDTADRRILGGHTFVPSGYLRDPFIMTSVTNLLAIGTAVGLQNPVLEIGGEPVAEMEGELTFISVAFGYRQAVREWLAASIQVGTVGRLGTNTTSLLAQGINATVGWDLGWTMRLVQRERWTLAGSVELQSISATIVNVLDWAEGVITGSGTELVRSSSALQGKFGLRAAYGFNPTVGILGSFHAGYGESFDLSAPDKWFVVLDGGVSLDLNPSQGWPLGFLLGGRYSSLPEAGEDIGEKQGLVLVRIAYTGREDFVIGLDITNEWLPQYFSDEPVHMTTTGIGLDYFF